MNFAKEQGDDDRLTDVLSKPPSAPARPGTQPDDPPTKTPQPGGVPAPDTAPADSKSKRRKSKTTPDAEPGGSGSGKNQSNGGGTAGGSCMEMTPRAPVPPTSPPPVPSNPPGPESCSRLPIQESSGPPLEEQAREDPAAGRDAGDGSRSVGGSGDSVEEQVRENLDAAVRSPRQPPPKDPASLFMVGSCTAQDSKV